MGSLTYEQFGNTDLGCLTIRDENNNELFVAFKGSRVLGVFNNKRDARLCIWAEYMRELDAELTKEEKQAKLEFFNKKERQSDFVAKLRYFYYQEYLKTAPTPEPTPPTKSPTPKFG